MIELYKNIGFKYHPFTKFSAEEERKYLSRIFFEPRYYSSLYSAIKTGSSRFIVGKRGIGKTALLYKLMEDWEKNNCFNIFIDDYNGVSATNNETEFMLKIIRQVTKTLSIKLCESPNLLKKLNESEKEKLSFIIKEFFQTISIKEYEKSINKITKYKSRNFFRNIYNYIFNKPINILISGAIEVVSDTVSKSLGLPKFDSSKFYKNYLPELELEQIEKHPNPSEFLKDYSILKEILNELSQIIKSIGYENLILVLDKIDEYPLLNNTVKSIADFLEKLSRDNQFLLSEEYSVVISLWSAVRDELNSRGIRFDKVKPVDITWSNEDIRKILDKRLSHFSNGMVTSNSLIKDENELNYLIELAHNSPRDLINLFSRIYDEQSVVNPNNKFFMHKALKNGKATFCKNYDYYSLYPSTRGRKEDVIKNINRVLKIGKQKIVTTDYVTIYKVSTPAAISYIKILLGYDLIKESDEKLGNAKQYDVKDPKLKYLIDKDISAI